MNETLSASVIAELLRPALIACAVITSALVFAFALRSNSPLYISIGWALATLLLPHVVLPLYIACRIVLRSRIGNNSLRSFRHWALPSLGYAALSLTIFFGAYWRDHQSFGAHLERAGAARLQGHHDQAAREYMLALKLQPEDSHTQKLLGRELLSARRFDEALTQFLRAEESASEVDQSLSFHIARSLDGLKESLKAQARYREFLKSSLCTLEPPDAQCRIAQERLADSR